MDVIITYNDRRGGRAEDDILTHLKFYFLSETVQFRLQTESCLAPSESEVTQPRDVQPSPQQCEVRDGRRKTETAPPPPGWAEVWPGRVSPETWLVQL